jgi:anti-sigma B factor antagonist
MDFKIKESQEEGVTILELFGGLDAHSAPQLDSKLKDALAAGKAKLVIAMVGLDLISSAGWSIFIETAMQCKEKGGDIRLAEMKSDAAKIFRIMGLNSILKSFESSAEAAASFK